MPDYYHRTRVATVASIRTWTEFVVLWVAGLSSLLLETRVPVYCLLGGGPGGDAPSLVSRSALARLPPWACFVSSFALAAIVKGTLGRHAPYKAPMLLAAAVTAAGVVLAAVSAPEAGSHLGRESAMLIGAGAASLGVCMSFQAGTSTPHTRVAHFARVGFVVCAGRLLAAVGQAAAEVRAARATPSALSSLHPPALFTPLSAAACPPAPRA